MGIPLVRNNSVDDINTSIIAIKKELGKGGSGDMGDVNVNVDVKYEVTDTVEDGNSLPVTSQGVYDYVEGQGFTPVDEVEKNNMKAVTSNAVAGACVRFPDYARNLYTTAATSFTMPEDGYITYTFFGSVALLINNINVSTTDNNGSSNVTTFQGYAKKGDIITQSSGGAMVTNLLKIFALK